MVLTKEQATLLYKLIDYLDIPHTQLALPQAMPKRSIFVKGEVAVSGPDEYATKLAHFPEDLRQGLLKEGIVRLSVDFNFYKLGNGEVGEDGAMLVSPGPFALDLETRVTNFK